MSFEYESIPTRVFAFQVLSVGPDDRNVPAVWFDPIGSVYVEEVKDGENIQTGDYVIFLSKDDVYRCPQDVFEAKYREVLK